MLFHWALWLDQQIWIHRVKIENCNPALWSEGKYAPIFRHMRILKVIRKDKTILLPDEDFRFAEGDYLDIMSIEANPEAYLKVLNLVEDLTVSIGKTVTLHDYVSDASLNEAENDNQIICCPIEIDKSSEFYRKAIWETAFREKYQGYIIGIERDNLPICNPDPFMSIEKGDLLWVLGGRAMADQLLLAGYLEEGV